MVKPKLPSAGKKFEFMHSPSGAHTASTKSDKYMKEMVKGPKKRF